LTAKGRDENPDSPQDWVRYHADTKARDKPAGEPNRVNKGEQRVESVGCPDPRQSVGFISACGVAFAAGVAATAYFCRSMCCEWKCRALDGCPDVDANARPTRAASATSFLLMWLAMMVAMSAVRTADLSEHAALARRSQGRKHARVPDVVGFWLLHGLVGVGAGIYAFGVAFATATTRWESFSRTVPCFQERR